jgi:hypothetical protein
VNIVAHQHSSDGLVDVVSPLELGRPNNWRVVVISLVLAEKWYGRKINTLRSIHTPTPIFLPRHFSAITFPILESASEMAR